MTAVEIILLTCMVVGIVLAYAVGHFVGYESGISQGRRLEAEDQIGRSNPGLFTGGEICRIDRSRKTFPGMSEVKAVDVRRTKL